MTRNIKILAFLWNFMFTAKQSKWNMCFCEVFIRRFCWLWFL